MIIKDIVPLKKGNVKIVFNDGECAFIYGKTAENAGLYSGVSIDPDDLEELISASEKDRAFENALYILEYRPHAEKELVSKLKAKGFSNESALYAVDKTRDLGLINDGDFARLLCEDLINRRGYGKKRIEQELYKRGVSRDITEETLGLFEFDGAEAAAEIIKKRFTPLPNDESGKRRMNSYLIRRGFSFEDIRKALSTLCDDTYYEDDGI